MRFNFSSHLKLNKTEILSHFVLKLVIIILSAFLTHINVFTLNKAKYRNPITNTWPEVVTEGGKVNLYCNATDGYPAGFIHWFDRSGTNWTVNSNTTKATKDSNGLKSVALSSRLTFKTIDASLAPFRCIVLNSRYAQDGESTISITSQFNGN